MWVLGSIFEETHSICLSLACFSQHSQLCLFSCMHRDGCIFLYGCTNSIACMHHVTLPIHLCGHPDSVCFLPVCSAAVNTNVQVLGMLTFSPLDMYPGDLELGHMVDLFSGFGETSMMISMTPNSRNGVLFPYILPSIGCHLFSWWDEMDSQDSFLWSLGMLNDFSNICWPFVSLLLRLVYSFHKSIYCVDGLGLGCLTFVVIYEYWY